jgi:hypothetical protein
MDSSVELQGITFFFLSSFSSVFNFFTHQYSGACKQHIEVPAKVGYLVSLTSSANRWRIAISDAQVSGRNLKIFHKTYVSSSKAEVRINVSLTLTVDYFKTRPLTQKKNPTQSYLNPRLIINIRGTGKVHRSSSRDTQS